MEAILRDFEHWERGAIATPFELRHAYSCQTLYSNRTTLVDVRTPDSRMDLPLLLFAVVDRRLTTALTFLYGSILSSQTYLDLNQR